MNFRIFLASFFVISVLGTSAFATTVVTKEELVLKRNFIDSVKSIKEAGGKVGLYIGRNPKEEQPLGHDPITGEKITWFTVAFPGEHPTTASHLAANMSESFIFKHEEDQIDLAEELKDFFDVITFDFGTVYSVQSHVAFMNMTSLVNSDHGKVLYSMPGQYELVFLADPVGDSGDDSSDDLDLVQIRYGNARFTIPLNEEGVSLFYDSINIGYQGFGSVPKLMEYGETSAEVENLVKDGMLRIVTKNMQKYFKDVIYEKVDMTLRKVDVLAFIMQHPIRKK